MRTLDISASAQFIERNQAKCLAPQGDANGQKAETFRLRKWRRASSKCIPGLSQCVVRVASKASSENEKGANGNEKGDEKGDEKGVKKGVDRMKKAFATIAQ